MLFQKLLYLSWWQLAKGGSAIALVPHPRPLAEIQRIYQLSLRLLSRYFSIVAWSIMVLIGIPVASEISLSCLWISLGILTFT
ncbi:MAG TPA: hypothetical protein V6D14_13325 [Coleofasciculaceae cyanobacterium]